MNLRNIISGAMIVCSFTLINAEAMVVLLNGTVTNEAGNPVDSAQLYLENHYDIDVFTDANGKYQFPVSISVLHSFTGNNRIRPAIIQNRFHFIVTEPQTAVRLQLFDLAGKCVKRYLNKNLAAKEYTINLVDKSLPPSMYIITLQTGSENFTEKVVVGENGSFQTSGKVEGISDNGRSQLAKKKEDEVTVSDVLTCMKAGYERQNKDINDYYTTVDFVLVEEDITPPVVTFFPGEDTVIVHFDDSDSLRVWMREVDIRMSAVDDKDPSPELMAPTNTLIDTTQPGFYFLKYQARDHSAFQNVGEKERFLVLFDSTKVDTEPPVFTIDPDTITIIQGEIYHDTGVSVIDAVDGDINTLTNYYSKYFINVEGEVNTSEPGTYTLTYRQIDTHLNLATATRTVIVKPQE